MSVPEIYSGDSAYTRLPSKEQHKDQQRHPGLCQERLYRSGIPSENRVILGHPVLLNTFGSGDNGLLPVGSLVIQGHLPDDPPGVDLIVH